MAAPRTRAKKSEETSGKKTPKTGARSRAASGEMLKRAKLGAMGPAWISKNYWSDEEKASLLTVILSRRVESGILPVFLLVDRTCLGIKGAFAGEIVSEDNADWASGADPSDMALVKCDLLDAQSVVYHAIDYAKSLGFEPTAELDLKLLGERPSELRETRFCESLRPYYVSGSRDDVPRVLSQLNAKLGAGNYDFVVGAPFRTLRRAEVDDSVDDLF